MLNLKHKIGAAMATAAAALSMMTMAAHADTSVTGNGAFSENDVNVSSNQSTTVNQTNNTRVNNNITNVANTGGVSANFNTGGDVTVQTGDATATTNVNVEGGTNVANIEGCCNGGQDVRVSGNGAFSENDVNVRSNNSTNLNQTNNTQVANDITNVANTGGVVASFNTGGDVQVRTGDATARTNVTVEGGTNVANVEGCCNGGSDVHVSGNGAFSENDVNVRSSNNLYARQVTRQDVYNAIINAANTGGIVGSFNTGGDVDVRTGDATAITNVNVGGSDNYLNLIGGGSNGGSNIGVSGNGAFSINDIYANTHNDKTVRQINDTNVDNDITNIANTGGVSAGYNTGGDVRIDTGDADARTNVYVGGSSNYLNMDGCCGGNSDIWISGNGAFSENSVRVNNDNDVDVRQDNNQDTHNNLHNIANTGLVGTSGFGYGGLHDRYNHGDYDHKYKDFYDRMNEYYDQMYKKYDDYDRNHHGYKKHNDYGYQHYGKYKDKHSDDYDFSKERYNKDTYHDTDYDHYKKYADHKPRYNHDKNFSYHPYIKHSYYDKDCCEKDREYKKYDHAYNTCGSNHNRPQHYTKFYPKHQNYKHGYFMNHPYDKFGRLPYNHNNYFHGFGYGGNTGGNVTVHTGDAHARTNTHVSGNSNRLFM